MRGFLAVLALTVCFLGAAAATSQAHYKSGDPESSVGWYFDGASTEKDGPRSAVKDPINFMFYGGDADQSSYTRERIEQHMLSDWDGNAVGTTSWVLSGNISSFCKVAQRVYWPGDGGASITSDKTDWHGVATPNQFTPPCLTQTHARFWDDHEHARITSGHGRLDQWVIGGIHHEHPVAKRKCTKVAGQRVCVAYGSTHKIDRDWDAVRYQMVKAMHAHCATRDWKLHPGAQGWFGAYDESVGFYNSGYIARFSLHHVSDGGCAGY